MSLKKKVKKTSKYLIALFVFIFRSNVWHGKDDSRDVVVT